MTRQEMVKKLIDDDIADISHEIYTADCEFRTADNSFLAAVLGGESWVPYNQLTDEQIESEYKERITNERY